MVAGLTPVMPSGALYMIVGIELDKFPHISTGIDFMEKLMLEESVYILPGEVSEWVLCSLSVLLVFPVSRLYQGATKQHGERGVCSYQGIL